MAGRLEQHIRELEREYDDLFARIAVAHRRVADALGQGQVADDDLRQMRDELESLEAERHRRASELAILLERLRKGE